MVIVCPYYIVRANFRIIENSKSIIYKYFIKKNKNNIICIYAVLVGFIKVYNYFSIEF